MGFVNQPDLIAEMLRSKVKMKTPAVKLGGRWLHLFTLQKEHDSPLEAGSGEEHRQDPVWSITVFLRCYKLRRFP